MATTHFKRLSFSDKVHSGSALNADLDNSFPEDFIVGDKVWLNGIYPARIQYIGETHLGPGDDWAGLVMDDYIGKHNGQVAGRRYFYCENKRGLFAKLSKLTRVPLRGQESPDSGYTNSPIQNTRQNHYSSSSSTLKINKANSSFDSIRKLAGSNDSFNKKFSDSLNLSNINDNLDRSYDYKYKFSSNKELKKNDGNKSSDLNSSFLSNKLSSTSSSPNIDKPFNYEYFRSTRSSTPKSFIRRSRSSSGSRQPRIHHIKVEVENSSPIRLVNKKDENQNEVYTTCSDNYDAQNLKIDDYVYVDSSKGLLLGKLRYLGPTKFRDGHWAGIELEQPFGKHDGKVENKRYFSCKQNYGLFAPCYKVHKANPKKITRFAADV